MSGAPALTAEFVERGYNNRAAVPDHAQWLAQCPVRSREVEARFAPQADLRFGDGPKETLDLFVPAGPAKGTFVYIHGGYWRLLDKRDFHFVAAPFLAQDLAVAVVNYDLCPAVSITTIVAQCRRALAWLAREGPRHGASTRQVVVGGHSAGGHLAAMMVATDWSAHGFDRPPITGAVSLSGLHDLSPLPQFSYNVDLKLDAAEAAQLSPANYASMAGVPTLIACGADETSEFLRQSQLLWDAWPDVRRPAGGPLFLPGKHHFSVVMDYGDPESAITRATLALF